MRLFDSKQQRCSLLVHKKNMGCKKRCWAGGRGDSHIGEDGQQYCGIVSHHVQCFKAVFKAGVGRNDGCVAAASAGAAVAQRWDVVENNAKWITRDSEKNCRMRWGVCT